jgi:AcrR family transcriptional regulator
MDKTEQIIKASLDVFTKKGYQQATTLEIAKAASVAEITLFRKFQSKKNLFEETVKYIFKTSFHKEDSPDYHLPFEGFFTILIDQKLQMISNNHSIVRMLITETLANTLPEKFHIINIIHDQIKNTIHTYFLEQDIQENPNRYTELIVGLLLRYAIIDHQLEYHTLSKEKREVMINEYLTILTPKE